MKIQVISNLSNAHKAQFMGRTAIVIDVIRTSTSIIAALEAGAASVIPVETVMEAKNRKRKDDLLGGERFCKKISGFDFGNSPIEYANAPLKNKNLIFTTTNGTRAIKRSATASELLIGALTNATACAQASIQTKRDLVILCAGSHDQFTIEDGFCAGLMIEHIMNAVGTNHISLDDLGYAMLSLYKNMQDQIDQLMHIGLSSRRLKMHGCPEDLQYCMKIDSSTTVPIFQNGCLVPYS